MAIFGHIIMSKKMIFKKQKNNKYRLNILYNIIG